ncbi:hypothetical protein PV326_005290 [Microctonus aethiopoides]|nr:hypothetical protein PV326_005290 [Microctonus aethiopoides]
MNLLPKCHEEFSKKDYWDTFFKTRGKKAFEWYGEYPELCGHLSKYVKIKDNILVVGCGNSKLSMDLHDVGYSSITNIDISKVVIDQMKEKNKVDRPNLIFEQMDATKLSYSDNSFSVVIDKGTLDALMPNDNEETLSRIDKYFHEINRVLRKGGRYICISLLQEHILRKLISYFPSSDFMFRVIRCDVENKTLEEDGSTFPVFFVLATKFPGLSQQILELTLVGDSPTRVANAEELINSILSVQQSSLVCDRLKKKSIADVGEINLDLFVPGNDNPRYTIYILDRPRSKGKTFVVFLVPQGRDTHWLFSTKEGRQDFIENIGKDRTAVVVLRRNHTFKDWEEVKEELTPTVLKLSPPGLPPNTKIEFLSLGPDVGKRITLYEGDTKINGRVAIEDAFYDNAEFRYRRLIFLSNPFVVQSEAQVKSVKTRRGKVKDVVDYGVLACEHHAFMCVGVNAIIDDNVGNEVLVIGLGGGGFCMFLHQCFPKLKVTAVEIDESIRQLAKEWFNFIEDERSKVEIADGIKFMEDSMRNGKTYDAILFDVNTNDTSLGISLCRDKSLRPKILNDLKNTFSSVVSIKIKNMVNEILFCSKVKKDQELWKKECQESARSLNSRVIKRKLLKDDVLDAADLLEGLSIEL